MTALSIRHMNFTLQTREHAQARRDAEWYASLPTDQKSEPHHYWHVERRSKNGKRWIFHAHFYGSKREVAEFWRRHFQGKSKQFRLHHRYQYSA